MKDEHVDVANRLSTDRELAAELEATLQAAVEAFEEVAHNQRAAGAVLGGMEAPTAERNARTAEAHGARARLLMDRVRLGAAQPHLSGAIVVSPDATETFGARVDRALAEVLQWAAVQESPALTLSPHELRQLLWVGVRAADGAARPISPDARVVPAGAPAPIASGAVRQ
jgi:hypothetical protein